MRNFFKKSEKNETPRTFKRNFEIKFVWTKKDNHFWKKTKILPAKNNQRKQLD